jgi:hypothetical protein
VVGYPNGREWLSAAAIHILVIVLFFVAPLQAPRRRADYVVLQPPDTTARMVFVPGHVKSARAARPTRRRAASRRVRAAGRFLQPRRRRRRRPLQR